MVWAERLYFLSDQFLEALRPLWLGCVVIGLMMAIPGFVMVYYLARRLLRRQTDKRQKTVNFPLPIL